MFNLQLLLVDLKPLESCLPFSYVSLYGKINCKRPCITAIFRYYNIIWPSYDWHKFGPQRMPFKIFQLLLYSVSINIHCLRKCWTIEEQRIDYIAGCYVDEYHVDLEQQKNKEGFLRFLFFHLQWNVIGVLISSSVVSGGVITAHKDTLKHEGIT